MTTDFAEPQAVQATALPALGTPLAGGFYAGQIYIGDTLKGLVVAPKAAGEIKGRWLHKLVDVPGAESYFDGLANTQAMANAGSELAKWALGLQIGGTDERWSAWHLPARDQLELLYRHLKPTTDKNVRFSGDNPSSSPVGYAYRDLPKQTELQAFAAGGAEAMSDWWYWSSTQYSADYAWCQGFNLGNQYYDVKEAEGWARAVRLIHLDA